ncbi:MAG: phosphoglycerate kinase [Candidatus Paceibacterota bacterium]
MKTKFSINSIKDCDDLAGQRVFLRGALNVPVEVEFRDNDTKSRSSGDGVITDDYRLQKLLPTIAYLREQGARIILAGHMSGPGTTSPDGSGYGVKNVKSLKPLVKYFEEHFELTFITDYASGAASDAVNAMGNGEVVLLENLRQYEGEKANDPAFAQMLAGYGDIYVNDAFPTTHRAHASIVGVPTHLPAYAGLQFARELEELSAILHPDHPFTFILGGAKFSTKLPLVEKFSGVADSVFVAGALANAYLAASGQPVGNSVLPEAEFDLSAGLASDALKLPTDVLTLSADGETSVRSVADVIDDETIVDLGPETLERMIATCREAKLVVWNGPLGWYEKGYANATDRLAAALKKVAGKTILGGGDTTAVILDDMSVDDFSFVSTAGGAMITFLSEETLPGIESLQNNLTD